MVLIQDFEESYEYTLHLRGRSVGVYGDFPTCKPKWRRTTSTSTVKGAHSQGARREKETTLDYIISRYHLINESNYMQDGRMRFAPSELQYEVLCSEFRATLGTVSTVNA